MLNRLLPIYHEQHVQLTTIYTVLATLGSIVGALYNYMVELLHIVYRIKTEKIELLCG